LPPRQGPLLELPARLPDTSGRHSERVRLTDSRRRRPRVWLPAVPYRLRSRYRPCAPRLTWDVSYRTLRCLSVWIRDHEDRTHTGVAAAPR
jgi:hypothetical protein